MKSFKQQIEEWLALSKEERIAIMSKRPIQGIFSNPEIDDIVDSDAYEVCFGELEINKDI